MLPSESSPLTGAEPERKAANVSGSSRHRFVPALLVLVCVACGSADAVSKHVLLQMAVPPLLSATVGSTLRFCFQLPMVLIQAHASGNEQLSHAATTFFNHSKWWLGALQLLVETVNSWSYSLANSYSSQPAVVALLTGVSFIWSPLMAASIGMESCRPGIALASVGALIALGMVVGLPMLGQVPAATLEHQNTTLLPTVSSHSAIHEAVGTLLALVCGIAMAGSIVTYRYVVMTLSNSATSIVLLAGPFSSLLAACVSAYCLLVDVHSSDRPSLSLSLHLISFWVVVCVNAFLQAVYMFGLSVGTKYLTSFEVCLLILTEVIWAPMYTAVLLHELPSLWTLPGSGLLLVVLVAFAVGL